MSGERSSSERKRVRFRDEADIRESPASEIGARKKPRRDVMTVERLHTVHDDPMFALEGMSSLHLIVLATLTIFFLLFLKLQGKSPSLQRNSK